LSWCLLGSRLVKSTRPELRQDKPTRGSFVPVCRNGWRYA
jgi:hypothetical protein